MLCLLALLARSARLLAWLTRVLHSLVTLGWSEDEDLIAVLDDGALLRYSGAPRFALHAPLLTAQMQCAASCLAKAHSVDLQHPKAWRTHVFMAK